MSLSGLSGPLTALRLAGRLLCPDIAYHNTTVRLSSGRSSGNTLIILKSGVNHMAFIRVHRLKGHAPLIFNGFFRHFFRESRKGLFPLGAIVFSIYADAHTTVGAVVYSVIGKVLDGIQGLSTAANHGSHSRAGEIYQQATTSNVTP